MWNSYDDVNEYGETVQLYVPTKGPARRTNTDTMESHIGGEAYQRDSPVCVLCQDPMPLLAQLRLPAVAKEASKVDRMILVFCCPRAACFEKLEFVEGFASEDGGIMSCQTVETPVVAMAKPPVPVKSSWYTDDNDDNDGDNEWKISDNDGGENMANLEKAMAAMEQNLKDGALPKQSKPSDSKTETPSARESDQKDSGKLSFPCYLLTKQFEPPASSPAMEEDDVGLSANDEKIQNMLARYMVEEEDEDILAALKGADLGGGGFGEEDERLTEEDRLLLGFQDRLRRVPRQVIRYAKGGMPLWSIPSTKGDKPLWTQPTCGSCGTRCNFEMQLLPALLHVLQVDHFASADKQSDDEGAAGIDTWLSKGMNWGSVAVFTCSNQSCDSTSGALVIQASVDGNPEVASGNANCDLTPTMAVVEDLEDDADFEPYQN